MRRGGKFGFALLGVAALLTCAVFWCGLSYVPTSSPAHGCCHGTAPDEAKLDGCTSRVFQSQQRAEVPPPQIAFQTVSALPGPKNGGDSVPSPKNASGSGELSIKNRVLRL